ncbi:MAG TPA: diheme cytochrome c-553 [Bacteroidota bacterium]
MHNRLTVFGKQICVSMLLLSLTLLFSPDSFGQKKMGTADSKMVERGKQLVLLGGCIDCHCPKVMTPMGPMPDTTRFLAGHPAHDPLPVIPQGVLGPDKWGAITTNDLTAWYGPWGVSFPKNLTPDVATGIGSWTEEMFIGALRTGKDMGQGRQILPPMPWMFIGQLPDADLKAIFAYLKSLPPISNAVPDPIPPTDPRITGAKQ